MELIGLGFKVMVMGLAAVFTVLILFYFMIKGLIKVFPSKE
ncbi:MAG: OadG-related small transporter subunit [Bacillota bacterium]|jgi:Na+-transporting methylmalonyl-CoA/oxaloacetate decarboxylase gamma subunit